MAIKVASSTAPVEQAAREMSAAFADLDPAVILFFASTAYDFGRLPAALQAQHPNARVFGCSTAGEIVSGALLKRSVVAMAMGRDVIDDAHIQYVPHPGNRQEVAEALRALEAAIGRPLAELDLARHVGVVLVDGLSGAEEALMDALGDLTDLTFIGGSAGDDLQFRQTWLGIGAEGRSGGAVLALLGVRRGFETIKTQSFTVCGRPLVATQVDEARRTVLAFNGRPAVDAYAAAVGTDRVSLAEHFMSSPLGLMVGNEPYVRSPQRVQDDAVVFYCNIRQGAELQLLAGGDIVGDTGRALEAARLQHGPFAGMVNFHCILRTLELERRGQVEAYGRLFQDVPTIGFSTYGEQYLGHINQTSTILALK